VSRGRWLLVWTGYAAGVSSLWLVSRATVTVVLGHAEGTGFLEEKELEAKRGFSISLYLSLPLPLSTSLYLSLPLSTSL
jgi:hypothetical protein